MPNAEQLLHQTNKNSHRRCSIKKLLLKILQYFRGGATRWAARGWGVGGALAFNFIFYFLQKVSLRKETKSG